MTIEAFTGTCFLNLSSYTEFGTQAAAFGMKQRVDQVTVSNVVLNLVIGFIYSQLSNHQIYRIAISI